jgi:hypothetical protein
MPLINYIGNRQECLDNNKRVVRGNAPPPIFLDYLVVGGGGYAGNVAGGGGGVVSGSIRFLPRFNLDVTVGSGGIGTLEIDAEASIIESPSNEFFVYAGPGYGSDTQGKPKGTSGEPQFNPKGASGGSPSQGSAGGAGGSAQNGQDVILTNVGGAGGSGSIWAFDSGSRFYGGGGGGYGSAVIASQARGGQGGVGGGGDGEGYTTLPQNGVDGLGGGAGGLRFSTATNGGSGIVKMRYESGSVMGATGGTITVSGSYVYHTFTASGQFVYQP